MVIFWLVVFVLALSAMFVISRPLTRSVRAAADDGEIGELQLQGEIAAINRDLEFELIEAADAEEAELEVRAIRANSQAPALGGGESRAGRIAAFAFLAAAPLAAVLLYLNIGAPQSLIASKDPLSSSANNASIAASGAVTTLEARVAANPNDFAGWMSLGDAYAAVNRAGDAANAFARAVALNDQDADAHSSFGEALVLQANGAITTEAREAFHRAVERKPGDPRARYYLAEARYQVGAIEEAVRAWAALLNDAPPGASWFGAVAARMNDAALEGGIALSSLDLAPSARQRLAEADAGAPAPQGGGFDAAIGRIHDGSAAFEDWMFAASTYAERGEIDRAKEILDRAEQRYERAPFVLSEIRKAKEQLAAGEGISRPAASSPAPMPGPSPGARGPSPDQIEAISALPEGEQRQMIEGMVAGLAERLAKAPDNPEGWRMLARSYRVLGRPVDSAAAWRELMKRGDAGAEDWRQFAFSLMDQRPEGDNTVGPELESALQKLQSFNADDPLALYNLGHAARNRGDKTKALQLWLRLQQTLPPDTPLAPTLSRLIEETRQ